MTQLLIITVIYQSESVSWAILLALYFLHNLIEEESKKGFYHFDETLFYIWLNYFDKTPQYSFLVKIEN